MEKRLIDGVEVQRGSSNVYADLHLPDAEKLKIKTGLVIELVILTEGTYQDWLEAPLGRANDFLVPYSADELVAVAPPVL